MGKDDRTIAFFVNNNSVLLGMKKRGHGQGKWNGFGGKLDGGESIESAMIRECHEEAGLTPTSYRKVAEIVFLGGSDIKDSNTTAHCYLVKKWTGEPIETEEMLPKWFLFSDIPYKYMWPSDRTWMPMLIKGESFKGEITFNENDELISQNIDEINDPTWITG